MNDRRQPLPAPADSGHKQSAQAATANMRMRLITVYVAPYYLERLDNLVRAGLYPNRAEAIRLAIRDLIREEASPL